MKLVLQKDHESYGIKYKAGEEIDVSPEEYQQITGSLIADRLKLAKAVKEAEDKLEAAKKVVK